MLSVIIPALNEQDALPATLARLQAMRTRGTEVIVVDGGSSDRTAALAARDADRVISAPRGRAVQSNAGVQAAKGDMLLFLHADTLAPDDADQWVRNGLSQGRVWGRFDVRIIGKPWILRVVALGINCRSRLSGIATGDQGLFMTRAAYDAVGGFPNQPLMEDVEISKRLLRLGRPACLRQRLATSGRRWEQRGVWRTIFLMWRLRWAYARGVAADELAKAYR